MAVRLVSFPSWELFTAQSQEYRDSVLPETIKARLAVEAGVSMGWERWVGEKGGVLAIDRFGASAPYEAVFRELGMTVENVVVRALALLR
jgi:transketolase